MSGVTNILFYSEHSSPIVTEVGSTIRGQIRLTLGSFLKDLTIDMGIRGVWMLRWKDKMDRAHEAVRKVLAVDKNVFSGPLFKGDHGIEVEIPIPEHLDPPPSLTTPAKVNVNGQQTLGIQGECSYILKISATWAGGVLGKTSIKSFDVPVFIMPASRQRALILNHPSSLTLSSIWTEMAPVTSSAATAPSAVAVRKNKPLYSRRLDKSTRLVLSPATPTAPEVFSPTTTANALAALAASSPGSQTPPPPPQEEWLEDSSIFSLFDSSSGLSVSTPIDKGELRYGLHMPRRTFLLGDTISMDLLVKTRSPIGAAKSISYAVLTIVGVSSFRLPETPSRAAPVDKRILAPVLTEKIEAGWETSDIGPIQRTLKIATPLEGIIPSILGDGMLEVQYFLRISLFVESGVVGSVGTSNNQVPPPPPAMLSTNSSSASLLTVTPPSAVTTSITPTASPKPQPSQHLSSQEQDSDSANSKALSGILRSNEASLVIEIPIILLMRGAGFNKEAIPYVPRGWRPPKIMPPPPPVTLTPPPPPKSKSSLLNLKTQSSGSGWELKNVEDQAFASSSAAAASIVDADGLMATEGVEEEEDPACLSKPNQLVGATVIRSESQSELTVATETSVFSADRYVVANGRASDDSGQGDTDAELKSSDLVAGRYFVLYPFWSNNPKEIILAVGDIVDVSLTYEDGWAMATNVTKGTTGFCPLHHLCREKGEEELKAFRTLDVINTSLSQKIEPTHDWRRLCVHEPRFKAIYSLMTSDKPDVGFINLPPAARITGTTKRMSSAWAEQERCPYCYNQAAPNAWSQ
ncbi:hypothetical protein HDU76_001296 [Blyttiomyces sp. JEL0837]|nr:hypothetical protein HDU76_001296 [Blyttiomyces sp. JEL0837]